MLSFRKILFPIDYSITCEAVVPYVKEVVQRFSADLTLVHAFEVDTDGEVRSKAERQGTDLVMLHTHGRGRIRRFLLGSVTAKVLARCQC